MVNKSVKWKVEVLQDELAAEQISLFFLGEDSFDDRRHTPGEIIHFRNQPLESLGLEHYDYWYVKNEEGQLIGVMSGFENEQRSGGYSLDYIAVHRHYRKRGIARSLIRHMIAFVQSKQGRYLLTYTCELPVYYPIQGLFQKLGFVKIGYCPDYYYEGEGRITYLLKL